MSRKPNPVPVEDYIDPKTIKDREATGIARMPGTKTQRAA